MEDRQGNFVREGTTMRYVIGITFALGLQLTTIDTGSAHPTGHAHGGAHANYHAHHYGHSAHYGHYHYRPYAYHYGHYYPRAYSYYYYPRAYYYPRVYSYYSPAFYYTPTYYIQPYYAPYYYSPYWGDAAQPSSLTPYAVQAYPGTFQYNGGPVTPVPMPYSLTPEIKNESVPIENGVVFTSTQMSGGTSQHGAVTPAQAMPRVQYPAYGEEPIAPAPRKR
jgi:hypothetical protein